MDAKIYRLTLRDGDYINTLIEDEDFVVNKIKIERYEYWSTGYSTETYDIAPWPVYEIYIKKNTAKGSKMPIMVQVIEDYNDNIRGARNCKCKDIITGRIFSSRVKDNWINQTNAVNKYFSGYVVDCDINLVADTLRNMTDEDFEAYEKALQKLNRILYQEHCKSENRIAEEKQRTEEEKQRTKENTEYINEFIKRRRKSL